MAIRNPSSPTKTITDTTTTGSQSYDFILPQDLDNVALRVYTGTFTGTNPTCDIYVQTSPDGGTTWYDLANIGQLTAAVAVANARWATFSTVATLGRGLANFIGSVAASTTAAAMTTGLPILGRSMRVTFKYGGTQLTNAGVVVDVFTNHQAAHS